MLTTLLFAVLTLQAVAGAFLAGFVVARRVAVREGAAARGDMLVESSRGARVHVPFEPLAERGTRSPALVDQAPAWRAQMGAVGVRLAGAGVGAVVFAHGTFTGTDPLSTFALLERRLPGRGREIARSLRRHTRATVERLLGDFGNFAPHYVELFEAAINDGRSGDLRIPCTGFVWSSENHHLGRVEGALELVRVLARHAELTGATRSGHRPRLLAFGHSHAGQLFALTTQLLSGTMASQAIMDVARVRGLDVGALEVDLATLARCQLDFVTLGAPVRYAWASVPNVRVLHVLAARRPSASGELEVLVGDVVQRLGGIAGSDLAPLCPDERRVNRQLGAAMSVTPPLDAVAAGSSLPAHGDVLLVDYGASRAPGAGSASKLSELVTTGFGHGIYTRLETMVFHAEVVSATLYGGERRGKSSAIALPARAASLLD